MLFICCLPHHTKISDIIDFFKDVVKVVRVRLSVSRTCIHLCYGHVEFASANEAKKALEKKNGEYLLGSQIILRAVKKTPIRPRPKYCIDYKVCYKDYLPRGSLPIEEDETPPNFVEDVVLFVANLSPQTKLISDIKDFFKDVGEVVSVRLIVNHEGKHDGYAFVDFASAHEAKKALEKKNGEYLHDHKIFLEVAKTAPYPPRPKHKPHNLAEKLCYEDYLRRQNLVIEEDDQTPNFVVEAVVARKRTLFVSVSLEKLKYQKCNINFFKDVGQVVSLRLIVDYTGKHVGDGFVEFASADEAEKALETNNGEYICMIIRYQEHIGYEDYLRQESLLIEEDEAVEGLSEIFLIILRYEVAARRKTLFIANIPCKTTIPKIIDFFKTVGRVVLLRLIIVDYKGQHVGCGFIEFVSANVAEKALVKKNNRELFLDVAEIAPYPLRPKYNLAEKLWSKVESLQKQVVPMMGGVCCKKVIFSYDD
ncbi:hypothetical protein CARUB_v10006561mg [Capsella rubella]|uniref:RRM domain-containing protein n=1 Tax=Capsella rubella TaxID=81985 RepID=R0H3K4_9BRAS|nr:hypothetical protein CARUB_v10006561mg [Capsella rubella]